MNARRTRLLPLFLVVLLGVFGTVVAQPLQAAADDHPYTTPGQREYNGRLWNTVCEQYSSTVSRCRAEIWASQARVIDGRYQLVNEFIFNNLTYLASNGANWRDKTTGEINPLAKDGQFTGTDGRLWKTECATQWTGQNGCRSFTFATVINAENGPNGWTFTPENKWMFNNVVQFVPGTRPLPRQYDNPCDAPPPAGFTFTREGRPHVIKPGYEPPDHYNPISLANFIKVSLRSTTLKDADKLCFALLGANHLIEGGQTRTYEGRTSLWFPYPFEFSANPTIGNLQPGWYSGLGQAGAMTAFMELATYTGNNIWNTRAEQVFESYFIPLEQGGFTNRSNGFLWFEEYPTTPPTVVYNGHFQNVLGLHSWAQRTGPRGTGDQRAWDLFDEAVESLKTEVPKMRIPIAGGTMSSYDMVRGYDVTPLRAVAVEPTPTPTPDPTPTPTPEPTEEPTVEPTEEPTEEPTGEPTEEPTEEPVDSVQGAPTANISQTLLNGEAIANLRIGTTSAGSGQLLRNPAFADANGDGIPENWSRINTNPLLLDGRWLGVRPRGTANGWAGVQQVIPVTPEIAGKTLTLAFESRVEITSGSGTGGKVPVYAECPSGTTLIHENAKNRTKVPAWSATSFTAPPLGCSMRVQFLTYSYGVSNTTAWYKNVELRVADQLGAHTIPAYDIEVHRTPENILTLTGTGAVRVEAYDGGRWQAIETVNLSAEGVDVVIPERYTGRNVNVNYHDGHVSELQRIACYSGVRMLDDLAKELYQTSVGTPYDPTMFGTGRNCVPETITLAMGEEVIEVAAAPEPMEVTPAAVPMSMDLPHEAEPEDQ